MFIFPDCNKVFEMHTDASDYQFGSVISQKMCLFPSSKNLTMQHNYTVGEQEILWIIETLKEFGTMLLGYVIKIYPDHKKLINTSTVKKINLF